MNFKIYPNTFWNVIADLMIEETDIGLILAHTEDDWQTTLYSYLQGKDFNSIKNI